MLRNRIIELSEQTWANHLCYCRAQNIDVISNFDRNHSVCAFLKQKALVNLFGWQNFDKFMGSRYIFFYLKLRYMVHTYVYIYSLKLIGI